jgi:hypothetical protein
MDPMTKVSVRDFTIFQLKLLIDGLKDGVVFTISIVAFAADLILRRHGQRRCFYQVMRVSEKFDLWLNLHGATEGAEDDSDGLFGLSEAGSDTMLGQLEQLVRGGDRPLPWKDHTAPRSGSGSSSARLM